MSKQDSVVCGASVTGSRVEVRCGDRSAVFVREGDGYRPDWFYLGGEPRLRFKGHHFLSLNTLRPKAQRIEEVEGGVRFGGCVPYGGTTVDWSVAISADPAMDGFTVETEVTPERHLEVHEGMSFFETPAEYDETEEQLHLVGMNPAAKWRGVENVTPKMWWVPETAWSHPRSHRNYGLTQTPYLCTRLSRNGQVRCYTFCGDWSVCSHRVVTVSPGQDADGGALYWFSIGGMTWRASMWKDPNFIFEGGKTYRQKLSLSFSDAMPGGTLDAWLLEGPFSQLLWRHFPADGYLVAERNARKRGVTVETASRWYTDTVTGDVEIVGFYHPTKGVTPYCPETDTHQSLGYGRSLTYLRRAGPIAYQGHVRHEPEWLERLHAHLPYLRDGLAAKIGGNLSGIGGSAEINSILRFLPYDGDDKLEATVRSLEDQICETPSYGDHGCEANAGLTLSHAADYFGDDRYVARALELLELVTASLDGDFWHFGCENKKWGPASGGQVHTQGLADGVHLALWAHRRTGERSHLANAQRLARMMAALCYATFNDSDDPDFDPRGWCNGSTSGRDLYALFPPWEAAEGIRALASLIESRPHPALYGLIWYFSRGYVAAFPAARRNKRGWSPDGRQKVYYGDVVASDKANYRDRYPYVCYEDPWNQTMLASYQTDDVVPNYLTFGGGLARTEDDRLLVLCPRAVRYEPAEATGRLVHLWNPIEKPIQTALVLPGLPVGAYRVSIGEDEEVIDLPTSIGVDVSGRSALVVTVQPV